MTDPHSQRILILDFGSQYTQLIARRVREAGVYCELYSYDTPIEEIRQFSPRGIILSGGPESVTQAETPRAPKEIFEMNIPILGICYGQQTMAAQLGGVVEAGDKREFGYARVRMHGHSKLFRDLRDEREESGAEWLHVWMSHGDKVTRLPPGFKIIAETASAPFAGIADEARGFYGIQFHPEVTHTTQGHSILQRFVHDICGCQSLWTPGNIIESMVQSVRDQVGGEVAGNRQAYLAPV